MPEKSFVRFLDLIGVRLAPGNPASTEITFRLTSPQTESFIIPRGTEVATVRPFRQSFMPLVQQLNRELVMVEGDHPLLTFPYLFGQLPEGARGPSHLMEGDGIVFSYGDFGCLWEGGGPHAPASRSLIRSAAELGTNMGVYSYRRTHLRSVRMAIG